MSNLLSLHVNPQQLADLVSKLRALRRSKDLDGDLPGLLGLAESRLKRHHADTKLGPRERRQLVTPAGTAS